MFKSNKLTNTLSMEEQPVHFINDDRVQQVPHWKVIKQIFVYSQSLFFFLDDLKSNIILRESQRYLVKKNRHFLFYFFKVFDSRNENVSYSSLKLKFNTFCIIKNNLFPCAMLPISPNPFIF